MKSRMMISLLVIALAAALIGGGTMAWFTAKASVENTFTAGTVMISATEDLAEEVIAAMANVNPGDCIEKEITITNTGTKRIALRMALDGEWNLNEDWLWQNWDALCFSNGGTVERPAWNSEAWNNFIAGLDLEDPVTFTIDGWVYNNGYWYYQDIIDSLAEVSAVVEVCFAGPAMTNEYQGASYVLTAYFEAIQASNGAPLTWGVNYYETPAP